MMRKAIITATAVILLVIIVFFSTYLILTSPKNEGEFCVDDFSEEIELFGFTGGENYGNITDYKSAAKAGRAAIDELFGKHSSGSIFEWMGCDVQYDQENETYYVHTYHINPRVSGGAYDVIIKSDGTILAIWGEE